MSCIGDDADVLRDALDEYLPQALTLSESNRLDLHAKVRAFVDQRGAEGIQPEHMIVEIRQMARRVAPNAFTDLLVSEMVRWCLAYYYRDSVR